jgi:hypothetical protein
MQSEIPLETRKSAMGRNGDKGRGGETGKVKFRIIELEMEGGDATLQESLRSIAAALSRPSGSGQQPRVLTRKTDIPVLEVKSDPKGDEPQEIDTTSTEEDSGEHVTRAPQKPRVPRRPSALKVLDLDLKSGDPNLVKFCESKKSNSDANKTLLIAAWLQKQLKIDEIGADHINTCFRFIGWEVPSDPTAPLRGMKLQGWFNSGSSKGLYTITHIGLNEVEKL